VLVDAECTADAALPHLRRMLALQATRPEEELLAYRRFRGAASDRGESSSVEQTISLQRQLISSAFAALRPGGVMLYVTCSSDPAQGEDVVAWLLARSEAVGARLERVQTHGVPALRVGPDGRIARFTPAESNTSGLFVSRIVRVAV
jgi:16S rRNA C967 or C1407 C5-methylase (RsmB/RsmF family)